MVDVEWSDFWWNNITGPNMVVLKVADALNENKIVFLNVPIDLPWRYQMRSAIELQFRKNAESEDIYVHTIDVKDECENNKPGKFLLNRFGQSREIKNGYRERSGQAIQQYLLQNRILKNTIVWVKGLDRDQAKDWTAFCRDYNTQSVHDGLFVLEVHDNMPIDNKKATLINYFDYVSNYDVQLFDRFVLDNENRYSIAWKKYISTAVACLCDTDVEISLELLKSTNFKEESPLIGIEKISKSSQYSSRGCDKYSNHVLKYFRDGNLGELEHRFWSAQIQTLFPLIEMERVKLIDRMFNEINRALVNEDIYQYDILLEDPHDVEIGTLDYLRRSYKISIPDPDLRDWISFLHINRNELAHLNCCNTDSVVKLLTQVADCGPKKY